MDEVPYSNNVNKEAANIKNILRSAAFSSMPLTEYNSKPRTHWLTWNVRQAIKNKNKAWKVYQRHPSMANLIELRRLTALTKRTVKIAKKQSWQNFATSISPSDNLKEAWRKVKKLYGKPTSSILSINSNNVAISDPFAIANQFATEWASVSANSNLPDNVLARKEDFSLPNLLIPSSFNLSREIRTEEFNAILHSFTGSTPGADQISYKMLKNAPEVFKHRICLLYTGILDSGIFPQAWKTAVLVPIPKKSSSSKSTKDFRPISLISCLSKCLEKILGKRLQKITEAKLNSGQHAFRPLRGTITLLHDLEDMLGSSLSAKEHACVMSLDLEKAYDKIPFNFVCDRLLSWGIDNKFTKTIQSFMSNRMMRVKVNGYLSNPFKLENGIPQGSPLSTTLFVAFMDPLLDSLKDFSAIRALIYADNIILCTRDCQSESIIQLRRASERTLLWARSRGGNIPLDKAELLHVCKKRSCRFSGIEIEHVPIVPVRALKILGILFGARLDWNSHAKSVQTKLGKVLNLVKMLAAGKDGAPPSALIPIAKTLIHGTTGYGLTIYGDCSPIFSKKIQVAINNILRIASGAYRSTPTRIILTECGMVDLPTRTKKLRAKLAARQLFDPSAPLNNISRRAILNEPRNRCSSLRRSFSEIFDRGTIIPNFSPPIQDIVLYPNEIHNLIITSLAEYKKENTSDLVFRKKFLEMRSLVSDRVEIYTDASKSSQQTGLAVVRRVGGNNMQILHSYQLPSYVSVFEAELFAIWLAAEVDISGLKKIIYTDSLSAVQAINNTLNGEFLPTLVRNQVINKHTLICWVPSHVGIEGNDFADRIAREVVNTSANCDRLVIPPSPHGIVGYVRAKMKRKWMSELSEDNIESVKNYYSNFGSSGFVAKEMNLPRFNQVVLLRLRTGHTRLTHSFPTQSVDRYSCPNCNLSNRVNVQHLLLDCPKAVDSLSLLGIANTSLSQILSSIEPSPHLFELLSRLGLLNKIY